MHPSSARLSPQRALRLLALVLSVLFVAGLAVASPAQATSLPSPPPLPSSSPSPSVPAQPTPSTPCGYDICGVRLPNVNGRDYLTSRGSSESSAPVGVQPLDVPEKATFNIQDAGDGSVYIRDYRDQCLVWEPIPETTVPVWLGTGPCTGSVAERWYFQNQDYANSWAIRKVGWSDGSKDDRCMDVSMGETGPRSKILPRGCKKSSSNWQKFMAFAVDPSQAQAVQDAIQDRATRFAATQCEEAKIVTCGFLLGGVSGGTLSTPEVVGLTGFNYDQIDQPEEIKVQHSKSATVSFGWGSRFSLKVEAGALGFAKTEWTVEMSWNANKSWTDTQSIDQTFHITTPAGGYAWAAYAQTIRTVTGKVTYTVKDTGKSWTAPSTVTLPSQENGPIRSAIILCNSRSTNKFCIQTAPVMNGLTNRSASTAKPAGVDWLTAVEDDEQMCSGTAISESWVLTSKSCPTARVRFVGAEGADAPAIAVDRTVDAASGNIRLLHLSTPRPLSAYPSLDLTGAPTEGDTATAYTVGTPGALSPSRSQVSVSTVGADARRGGDVIQVGTKDAPALQSDAGGPLLVGGRLVGIGSWQATAGASPTGGYAALRSAAAAIAPEVIGDVVAKDGVAKITIGKNLFASKTRVMVWADGRYVAETYDGTNYYAGIGENADGTMTLYANVPRGALVQVGISDGAPGEGASAATTRVQQAVLADTATTLSLDDQGHLTYTASRNLTDGDRRVMVFVNDRYIGETYRGVSYYMGYTKDATNTTMYPGGTFARGDEVEIRLVQGAPGEPTGTASVLSQRIL